MVPIEPDLPPESLRLAAERFKVLSDGTRLSILQSLRSGELSVNEIAVEVGASQPTVSKHLAILARSGMITRRQEGNRVLCRITDPIVFKLCDLVCGDLGGS
jgi:DNA-binding transcriptional ArsR family regulator